MTASTIPTQLPDTFTEWTVDVAATVNAVLRVAVPAVPATAAGILSAVCTATVRTAAE